MKLNAVAWGESNRGGDPSLSPGTLRCLEFSSAGGAAQRLKGSEAGEKPRKGGFLEAENTQGAAVAPRQSVGGWL